MWGQVKPNTLYQWIWKIWFNVLRLQNSENGEPEINNIGEKSQDNNKFILHKNIINTRGNQITDMIQEF